MTGMLQSLLRGIDSERPVLIAGPTASGKSALALEIADRCGGAIVNADALQVYTCWRVLTARPQPADEVRVPHLLYGHVAADQTYSVGEWLRDVVPLLTGGVRPVIVGGTGLYFSALTQGLAAIPPIPPAIRAEADRRRLAGDIAGLLAGLDPATRARIDPANPVRVQRAWEVLATTGRGLADWQAATGAPLLPLAQTTALVLQADRDWLGRRIDRRFASMLQNGALEEARAALPGWNPAHPSAKAIGAVELVAHLRGEMSLDDATAAAALASRRYAKRQRTWFRARMQAWRAVPVPLR